MPSSSTSCAMYSVGTFSINEGDLRVNVKSVRSYVLNLATKVNFLESRRKTENEVT